MNEQEAFTKLKEMIFNARSLDVSQYKENYLRRRIAVRTRALQLAGYGEYINYIENRPEEYNILLDKLTINVTQFFRDPEAFEAFEKNILPGVFEKSGGEVRIWSAGCSSGEEPYSIAIAIEETALKAGVQRARYRVEATDLDEAILRRAMAGEYEGRTLENVSRDRRGKYFNALPGGKYLIDERLKSNVVFSKKNLMEPFKGNYFDVVFCRNVIIYFAKDLQRKVLQFFYDSLKEDGILVLGKTETMLLDFRDRFKCIDVKERMFRKQKGK